MCWTWPGTLAKGCPQARLPRGTITKYPTGVSARRVIWLAVNGPVTPGEVVHDSCGNRLCCNPEHLVTLTFRSLIRQPDMHSTPAEAARRTHCPRGHELTPENTIPYLAMRGWRGCHICLRERHTLIRAAAKTLGLQWREYAAEYGLSRAEATRVLAEAGIDPTCTELTTSTSSKSKVQ